MHPENIRKILAEPGAIMNYMRRHECSEHTASQLFDAWRTILWLWDAVPEARKKMGGE